MDTSTAAGTARAYIEAVGSRDVAAVDNLLADSLEARVASSTSDKAAWMAALERLLPAIVRTDIRDVYENGDHACAVYEFVTNTPAGAVVCAENVHVTDGRITDIELVFDSATFAPVTQALAERATASV